MRKLFQNMKSKNQKMKAATNTLISTRGEGYIDTAVKIIIGVVIGGVLLAGLYTLFNATVIPNLTTKIGEMFSYTGAEVIYYGRGVSAPLSQKGSQYDNSNDESDFNRCFFCDDGCIGTVILTIYRCFFACLPVVNRHYAKKGV